MMPATGRTSLELLALKIAFQVIGQRRSGTVTALGRLLQTFQADDLSRARGARIELPRQCGLTAAHGQQRVERWPGHGPIMPGFGE